VTTHDYQIQNAGGRTVRLDFNGALMAQATCNSGAIEPPDPIPGMLWLDTTVLPDGQVRQRNQSNTAWVTMSGIPPEATFAQVTAGTDDATFVTPAGYMARLDSIPDWQAFNCLVNGAMRVSQENADTALPIATAGTVYPADQWPVTCSTAATQAAVTAQRVALLTPRKSEYRLRITVTTAKALLATADYLSFWQAIEGLRVARLGWGAAGAKQVIVRFGFKGPAGTYSCNIRSPSPYRSYCAPFTISAAQANTDTEQTFVVLGDITGTWPVTASAGIYLWITVAAGGSFQSVSGWQSGNFIGSTGMSNGLATVGNVFELFDVGFYVDERKTAVAPRWTLPTVEEELFDCQRYFVKDCRVMYGGNVTSANVYYAPAGPIPVDMRTTPSIVAPTSLSASNFTAAVGTLSVIVTPSTGHYKLRENRTASGTGVGLFQSQCDLSARM